MDFSDFSDDLLNTSDHVHDKKTASIPMLVALFVVLFYCESISSYRFLNALVVWNVGQGQWITWITPKGECLHVDTGGEFHPLKKLLSLCQRQHFYLLTHQDSDHQVFLKKLRKKASTEPATNTLVQQKGLQILAKPTGKSENEKSLWLILAQNFLITGDSPKKIERKLLASLDKSKLQEVTHFILGHHGSRTSNSSELLAELSSLQVGIVSARWARYHHPHPEVVSEFTKRKTPLLLTEKWGHLIFELESFGD